MTFLPAPKHLFLSPTIAGPKTLGGCVKQVGANDLTDISQSSIRATPKPTAKPTPKTKARATLPSPPSSPKRPRYVIAGYSDADSEAPDPIRRQLFEMTPAIFDPEPPSLLDFGNLTSKTSPEERPQAIRNIVVSALKKGYRWIGLGGPVVCARSDGAGFIDWCEKQKRRGLIIHFDSTLGFMAADLPGAKNIDFCAIGAQSHCNIFESFHAAKQSGAHILTWDEIFLSGERPHIPIFDFLEPWLIKNTPVFLSINISAFSREYAPRSASSSPIGFSPGDFLILLEVLKSRCQIMVTGIYGTAAADNPDDSDRSHSPGGRHCSDQTASLTALLLHRILT